MGSSVFMISMMDSSEGKVSERQSRVGREGCAVSARTFKIILNLYREANLAEQE